MDHLPLPQNSTRLHVQVPCLYDERYKYDGLAWDSFPQRCGFHMGRLLLGDLQDHPVSEVLSFIQMWGFFGILDILSINFGTPVKHEDFIRRTDAHESYITTAKLPDFIAQLKEQWGSSMTGIAEASKYLFSISHCCDVINSRQWLEEFDPVDSLPKQLDQESKEICNILLLSIAILGETIHPQKTSIWSTSGSVWGRSPMIVKLFKDSGWCDRKIRLLEEKVTSQMALYFMSAVRYEHSVEVHQDCMEEFCVMEKLKSYPRKHAMGCDINRCDTVVLEGPSARMVSPIVGKGQIPILTYNSQITPLPVSVGQYKDMQGHVVKYVAISHVWSDGLGNPQENSLPQCQISYIQEKVDALYPLEMRPVPFWLDTLCVLHSEIYRKEAIASMQDVYKSADKVLILDSSLLQTPASASPEDILLKVVASTWANRLWTLQEIMLAYNPYFQLIGGALGLHDLDVKHREHSQSPTYAGSEYLYQIGRQHIEGFNVFTQPLEMSTRLRLLTKALRSRSTSKPTDEAFCIAPLLNCNSRDFVNIPGEDRMRSLIASLSTGLPEFLFSKIPRYHEPGSRWIPRTLTSLTWNVKENQCYPSPRGLFGTFRGFRIHTGVEHPREGDGIVVEIDGKLVGLTANDFAHENPWVPSRIQEYAVVLADSAISNENKVWDGCYVTITSIEDGMVYACREGRVRAGFIPEFMIDPDKPVIPTTNLPVNQKWCIG